MDSTAKELRKLRKKLRQIEHLELLDRELNDEELIKISKKNEIRSEVQRLLLEIGSEPPIFSFSPSPDTQVTELVSEQHDEVPSTAEEELKDETLPNFENESVDLVEELEENLKDSRLKEEKEIEERLTVDKIQKSPPKQETLSGISRREQNAETKALATRLNDVKKEKKKEVPKEKRIKAKKFEETELVGHSDFVLSIAVHGDTLVSASRDTTVRVWSITKCEELQSLRGHTGSVTGVLLLPEMTWSNLVEYLKSHEDLEMPIGRIGAISSSLDCSVKIWDVESGKLIRSVYTYNGITSLAYDSRRNATVTGTDGGKIEVYNLGTKNPLASVNAHVEAVVAVKVSKHKIVSASLDTRISVWEWKENALNCIFLSDLTTVTGNMRIPRAVRGFDCDLGGDVCYFGDDGVNLKVLELNSGVLRKLPNHASDFGMTNAVHVANGTLFSSAFDLDSGKSYVNMRSLASPQLLYLESVIMSNPGRILCLASSVIDNKYVLFVGGSKLTIVREVDGGPSSITSAFIPAMNRAAIDSEDEDDDIEVPVRQTVAMKSTSEKNLAVRNNGSWCSIM